MAVVHIPSLDDPRLGDYREIKIVRRELRQRIFVVEGTWLVERLIASEFEVKSVLAVERCVQRISRILPDEVPLYVISNDWISRLVGFRFHRGVLACGIRRPLPSLEAIASPGIDPLTLVICPHVQNQENLGGILRVSAAFGVNGLVVGPNCPDPFSRRVLRVSMGAVLTMPVVVVDDLASALRQLRTRLSVQLAATVVSAEAESFDKISRPRRFALLLGREDDGLDPRWVDLSDRRITIPMSPGVDSLNVSVAAGILLYHLNGRQADV